MPKELLRDIVAEMPAHQLLGSAGPDVPVHVDHLGVGAGQVGHVLVDQLPNQVVVERGSVRR